MGYALLHDVCVNCRTPIVCNPVRVPSLRINGERKPLCKACFNKWNEIHRTSQGLPPMPLHPDAYRACHESELGD